MSDQKDTERKEDTPDAPVPEHVEIPNDDTLIFEGDETGDQGVDAQSPSAEDVETKDTPEEPQSMAEAIQAELEGKSSDPASETKETEDKAKNAAPGDDKEKEAEEDFEYLKSEVTDEELKDYSKRANARIRQLVEERNEARGFAEQIAPMLNFLHQNDIPQQDVDIMLDLTARLRHGDFAGFLNGIGPYVDLAMQYTGQRLPPDLQKQVSDGGISRQAAQELAQRRIQGQMHTQQTQQRDARDHQRDVREKANTIRSAVTNWEQQTKAKDPDYGLKEDMVRRTAQALMQENGVPDTVEKAIQYVETAYKEVNYQMGKLRPQRQATAPRPNGSVTKGGSTPRAEPSSMMEAAMQGLRDVRGGG